MPRLKCRRVACSAVAGLVRASTHGAAVASFGRLLAARGCKALPAPGCPCARSRGILDHRIGSNRLTFRAFNRYPMKHLIVVLAILDLVSSATAQSQFVIQRGSQLLVFDSIGTAIGATEDGDIVYLPGGAFDVGTSLWIEKSISLIGVGYHPDSTQATQSTSIIGEIQVRASNVLLEGIFFSDYVRWQLGGFTNLIVRRCNVGNLSYIGPPPQIACNGFVVVESIVRGIVSLSNQIHGVHFRNSFLGYPSGSVGAVITNCFIRGTGSSGVNCDYCTFTNNIVAQIFNGPAGTSVWSNNVLLNPSSLSGVSSSNVFVSSLTQVLIAPGNGSIYDYLNDYHVVPGSQADDTATDGSDRGLYGGASPWKDGAIPHNPHVYQVLIDAATDPSGNLPIQVKANAQQR